MVTNAFLMYWFNRYGHLRIAKQRRKERSYLVGIRRKNIGTDTTSWRWCQFRNINARPDISMSPKHWAHIDSVVTKALNLWLVHSNTERKEKWTLIFTMGGKDIHIKEKVEQCPSKTLTYWAKHYLCVWVWHKALLGSEVSSRWRRWEPWLHRSHWRPSAVKHIWGLTSSQT